MTETNIDLQISKMQKLKEQLKPFGWYLVVNKLIQSGFKVKLYYDDGSVRDYPDLFEMDPEFKGFAPVVPRKIVVYRKIFEKNNDELTRKLFGRGIVERYEKVVEINNRIGMDPDPKVTEILLKILIRSKGLI